MATRFSFRTFAYAFVVVVLSLSNIALLLQNREYRARLGAIVRAPEKGQSFAGLRGDVLGEPGTLVSVADGAYVLLYLSPSCHYCTEQSAKWKGLITALARRSDGTEYRVMGIADRATPPHEITYYLDKLGLRDIPVALVSSDDLLAANLVSTPTTVVTSPGGRVERVWVGLWDDRIDADVENAFGLSGGELKATASLGDAEQVGTAIFAGTAEPALPVRRRT